MSGGTIPDPKSGHLGFLGILVVVTATYAWVVCSDHVWLLGAEEIKRP